MKENEIAKAVVNATLFCIAMLLFSGCVPSYKRYANEMNRRKQRAEMIAEREVRRREGWEHSTVFAKCFRNDGYSVMVLENDDTRPSRGKMLVGASIWVHVDAHGKVVEYRYYSPHN